MWRAWVIEQMITKRFFEDLLLSMAIHEALYDVFPGLLTHQPRGFGRALLEAVFKDRDYKLKIPPSNFHKRPSPLEVEVLPYDKRSGGRSEYALVWRPHSFDGKSGKGREWVVSKSNTAVLNAVIHNLFNQLLQQYNSCVQLLHRVGVELPP